MNNKSVSLSEILGMSAGSKENPSYINGSFKAVVSDCRDGDKVSTCRLVDPDNANVSIVGKLWGRNASRYEGMIVLFSGAGMRRGEYKGVPEVSVGDKAKVDIFQNLNGDAGLHKPATPSAPKPPVMANINFHEELGKLGSLYTYCLKEGLKVREMAKMATNHDMTPEQFQACVSALFIESNKKSLSAFLPTSTNT